MKTVSLNDLFIFSAAKSGSTDDYETGDIPFVTSTESNNGIAAYVTPEEGDKVFDGPMIAISGLGHATLQLNKFLPKGNGGDSLTMLIPKEDMTVYQLLAYVSLFNIAHKWRFSFGRKCSVSRLKNLKVNTIEKCDNLRTIWNEQTSLVAKIFSETKPILEKNIKKTIEKIKQNA